MLNVITLVGRLTRDPQLRKTGSGTAVGSFTIACDDGRKGPDGKKNTLFMDCTVFGSAADTLLKYWRKGSLIGVYGRLVTRKYENKQGIMVTAYSVNCDRIEFVDFPGDGKKEEGEAEMPMDETISQVEEPVSEKQNVEHYDVNDDELPF